MIKNYFLVAIRYLLRQKLFSLINILGLSVGIAAFYLIFLHVQDEFSYDRFHENADRKYRVALERVYPEKVKYYAIVPHSIPEAFVEELPEVKSMVRMFGGENQFNVIREDQTFEESNMYFADSTFFEFFNIPLIYGSATSVLSDPNNIVLTRERAEKYFGDKNPVGEMFKTEFGEFTVTGVCADLPGKSHLQFNFIGSIFRFPRMNQSLYAAFDTYAYILLAEGADPDVVEARFPEIVDKYAAGEIEQQNSLSYKEYRAAGNGYNYFLQNVQDIHLHSQLEMEISPNSNIRYIRLFILVAIFVILIACINFMNLSTARASERAKEVGVRKVVGAGKKRLVFQYLTESFLVSLLGLLVGLVWVELILPVFNRLAEKELISNLGQIQNIGVLLGITIVCGILAGLYPAFVLSRYKPAIVLKGRFRSTRAGALLRKGLVVFQFSISLILIIFSLFVFAQIRYMINSDLGFTKDQVLLVPRAFAFENNREAFIQEVEKMPGVEKVAVSNVVLSSGYYFGWQCAVEEYGSEVMTTSGMVVDENFLDVMEIKLLEGRNFSKSFNDSLAVLVNREAIKEFGLTDPINKKLISRTRQDSTIREYRIVGIVEDFHYNSMHQPVNSFVLFHTSGQYGQGNIFNIKLKPENISGTISGIEKQWKNMVPDAAFEYEFLDEQVERMYSNERKSEGIFWLFTLLAIFIAAVGLFGLSAYTARQRTREFGIRKVFGAGFNNIMVLLSREFSRLILLSFIIAIPLGYLGTRNWLQNFEFRVDIIANSYIFVLAGVFGLLIAYLTVFYQAVKAASTRPSRSLRYE